MKLWIVIEEDDGTQHPFDITHLTHAMNDARSNMLRALANDLAVAAGVANNRYKLSEDGRTITDSLGEVAPIQTQDQATGLALHRWMEGEPDKPFRPRPTGEAPPPSE